MSNQPRDDDNAPIPVLGLRPSKAHTVPYTTDSANTSPSFDDTNRVVTLFSTSNAFIQTGASTVTVAAANGHFLPAQTLIDISLGSQTNAADTNKFISILAQDTNGTLFISERE
jgi:hypothetical protein